MKKLVYIHVPKTAGTSLNSFLSSHFDKSALHVENNWKNYNEIFEKNDFVSGHIPYSKFENACDLDKCTTIITLRLPIEHVVSHICWVRKLADPNEKKRFMAHPDIYKKIALKMKEYDFSCPDQLEALLDWLESIPFFLFHNNQTFFLNERPPSTYDMSTNYLEKAIENLNKVNLIGVSDEFDDFLIKISDLYGWNLPQKNSYFFNSNINKYGINLSNTKTLNILNRLIEYDNILYNKAKELSTKPKVL